MTRNRTFGLLPQFKRLSAMFGDSQFLSSRKWFLENAVKYGMGNQVCSYLFTAYTPEANPYLGSYHGNEIPFVFGGVSIAGNYTEADVALSRQMINYW